MPFVIGKDMETDDQKIDAFVHFLKNKYLVIGRDDNSLLSIFGKQFGVLTREEFEKEFLTEEEADRCVVTELNGYVILEWDNK